ncbi:MAG: choice-of-anchor J domain-containing protein [Bacteroidia bacterium]
MKKFTFIVALMFAATAIFATGRTSSELPGSHGKAVRKAHTFSKSLRSANSGINHTNATVLFSEDFAGGLPATWTSVDGAGNGVTWSWTTTGNYNAYEALSATGTTAANGYLIFDSDSSGGVGGEDGILTSPAIDCSGQSTVHFACNEFFRQYLAASAIISVSNDGTTWTEIHHAEAGLAAATSTTDGEATPNPNALDIDISAVAGNQATVYVRFEFIGDWDYYWFVDDVMLFAPDAVDGGVDAVNVNWNSCMLSAAEPVTVLLKNYGVDPISNFDVSYSVNFGTPVTETYSGTLNSGDTASYTFTATADLSMPMIYEVDAWTTITNDVATGNDSSTTFTESYMTDPTVAAYTNGFEDTDDYTGYTIADLDGDGVTFDITDQYPNSGTYCIRKPGSGVDDDNWFFTQCFDFQNTGYYTLTYFYKNFELANPCSLEVYMGSMNDASSMTTLLIQNPIPGDTTYQAASAAIPVASAGTYFLGFHFYSTQGTGTSSLRVDDIMVDFDNYVKELSNSGISIYPNPTSGKININNINMTDKDYVVSVYNSVGSLVYTKHYSDLNTETIDLSNQASGVYSVQLKSAKNTVNKSVVIAGN